MLSCGVKVNAVLATISLMTTEFSSRFFGVMAATVNTRREINDCTEQMSQAGLRISNAEDNIAGLQAKVHMLESKNKTLEDKLLDLETRSSLNKLRLVGLESNQRGTQECHREH